MLVQDIMQSAVVTADAHVRLADAYQTMLDHAVRHLPVMDNGALVGVITDRDLRNATSDLHPSPIQAHAPVREAMSADPITAGPLDPVEEAARLLRSKRIGCLPVMEGADLVGIVTVTDLLDAVTRLTGLSKPGGRVAVSLPDEPGQLARLTGRVAEAGADIRSVLSYYEDETRSGPERAPDADEEPPSRLRIILRLDTINVRPIAASLRAEGFDVVWPVEKPGSDT
jgi:acetoin utilization protein AcuB